METYLVLVLGATTFCLNIGLARLFSLENATTLESYPTRKSLRFVHPRMRTADVHQENGVLAFNPLKKIAFSTTSKNCSEKQCTGNNCVENMKIVLSKHEGGSRLRHRNVTFRKFSKHSYKLMDRIDELIPNTNSNEPAGSGSAFRKDSNNYFLRPNSEVSTRAFSRTPERGDRTVDGTATDQRHKRDKSMRLAKRRAIIDRVSFKETPELFTPSSSIVSIDRKFNQVNNKSLTGNTHTACSCDSTKCDCSKRGLTSVPQDLDTSITELLLTHNDLKTLPNNVFSRYSLLENLVLQCNLLRKLQDDLFNGLSRLTSLDLRFNGINVYNDISDLTFQPLVALKILRLNSNHPECLKSPEVPFTALGYLHNLQYLSMDNSFFQVSGKSFGPVFSNLTLLRHLTITCSSCKMLVILNTTFTNLAHITSLDISHCEIDSQTIHKGTFSPLANLKTLDISWNRDIGLDNLSVILLDLRNSSLQTLKMNYIVTEYSFSVIKTSTVQYLPRGLTTLVAKGNNIVSIERNVFQKLPKRLKTIDVRDNFIIMDPRDVALDEMPNLETLLIHSGYCFRSDEEYIKRNDEQFENNLRDGQEEDRLAGNEQKKKIVLPRSLKRVQVNVEDKPHGFLKDIDKRNNLEYLDLSCSNRPYFFLNQLSNLPNLRSLSIRSSSVHTFLSAVADVTSLNISGTSDVTDVPSLNISGTSNVTDGTSLNISGTSGVSFSNLSNLDLSLNQINRLHRIMFIGLDNLEYLRLDGNPLSQFGAVISKMGQLKLLNLNNTQLSNLPNDVRSHIDQLCKDRPGQVRVNMAGCPIQCDCFNLDFLKWMINSPAFDKNFTGYKCKYPDTSLKYILDGYQETIHVLDRECAKNYPMFLIVLAGTLVLLCAVFGAIVYRLRWKIRYLYYAAYLKFTDKHKNDNNQEFTYDVFISYDSEDQAFVTRCLSPELENRGLRLLIHTRDFVAGSYITSNIVMAVTESRKTLVVLTRNLVESTWCNYELQMATMEAVHTGRQVLVFLLKENIPSRELDVELLGHIRSNTYLPYPTPEEEGDEDMMKRFYDKLAHDLRC